MTTKKLQNIYPTAESIEQIGRSQLFRIQINGQLLLVSYATIIGAFYYSNGTNNLDWFITKKKYSKTTSRQINKFINSYPAPVYRTEQDIDELYHNNKLEDLSHV